MSKSLWWTLFQFISVLKLDVTEFLKHFKSDGTAASEDLQTVQLVSEEMPFWGLQCYFIKLQICCYLWMFACCRLNKILYFLLCLCIVGFCYKFSLTSILTRPAMNKIDIQRIRYHYSCDTSQLYDHCDVISNRLWCHQQNENREWDTGMMCKDRHFYHHLWIHYVM